MLSMESVLMSHNVKAKPSEILAIWELKVISYAKNAKYGIGYLMCNRLRFTS